MKQLSGYLRTGLYNIRHNTAYAVFCIFGTALTFVFIIILLQLSYIINNDTPPLSNSHRIIRIGDKFVDRSGQSIDGLMLPGILQMRDLVKDYEVFAITHTENGVLQANDRIKPGLVNFINSNYWQVYNFEFIDGRPFTQEDYAAATPVAVIKESYARACFGAQTAVGQNVEFQGNTYQIVGVVADCSFFANDFSSMWVPYKYNKYVPSGVTSYTVLYLFPEQMLTSVMKQNVTRALQYYFELAETNVDPDSLQIRTLKEEQMVRFGDRAITYGTGLVILLLLIIPAINIVSLSVANANTQATEIAIRRALGASQKSIFVQKISEHFLLVILGMILGWILVYPTISLFETKILSAMSVEGVTLLGSMNYWIILYEILPLCMLFSLLSGGIPAYKISRQNIAYTLKGGAKS
ncbi:ABC transporter permease [Millionella massiliensis]|uniref:ABC transporter permease n=1 Tax=Millionella massiliensis TaxID=1871023 RepID=UPI0008DAD32E|nr:ABC transporter permease [Millionella massiliensis]